MLSRTTPSPDNFRECLFEVTNQLQYGAQHELSEFRKKYLACIYSSKEEIESQLVIVTELLAEEKRIQVTLGSGGKEILPGDKKLKLRNSLLAQDCLVGYKNKLKSFLQTTIDESAEAARDFEDGGVKIREEQKKQNEVKELKKCSRGWSVLTGGRIAGRASTTSVFPHRLGPLGQAAVPELPQYRWSNGKLAVYYENKPERWCRDWGECVCECSSVNAVTLPTEVLNDLGIPEEAQSFVWVYPTLSLLSVDDQKKIAFAQIGNQHSLLAFGGYLYFKEGKSTLEQADSVTCTILHVNAIVSASIATSKRQLRFRAPVDINQHILMTARNFGKLEFKKVITQQRVHADLFCWIGPGQDFGELHTEHGAFVYQNVKGGGGLWFDIAADPPTAHNSTSKKLTHKNIFHDEGWCERKLREVKEVDWCDWDSKLRYMEERVQKEQEKNAYLQGHDMQSDVKYEQIIQLRHVKSGKFLGVIEKDGSAEVAEVDRGCYKVELTAEGSEGSWFYFRSFKRNQVGARIQTGPISAGPVYLNDEVLVQSNTLDNFQLHTSHAFTREHQLRLLFDPHRCEVNLSNYATFSCTLAYSNVHGGPGPPIRSQTPIEGDAEAKPTDQTEAGEDEAKVQETAASSTGGFVWKLQRYSSRVSKESEHFMQIGQAFRLYHPSAEAYMCASVDKGSKAANATHPVYLQPLGINGSFNPDDTSNQSAKQIFILERGDGEVGFEQQGGTANWQGCYRFLHLASGKYLTAEPQESGGSPGPHKPPGTPPATPKQLQRNISEKEQDLTSTHRRKRTSTVTNTNVIVFPCAPALVFISPFPQTEKDEQAWEQTKFHLTTKARLEISLGLLHVNNANIPAQVNFCMQQCSSKLKLSTAFAKKPLNLQRRASISSVNAGASISSANAGVSSFDQEKQKGLALVFSEDELDHNCSDMHASFVSAECLQRVEKTLAERTALRAIYAPGQPHTMLHENPREAETRAKTLLRTLISELLGHSYTTTEIVLEMSTDDFWKDPIPDAMKQAAARELKVIEDLFIVVCCVMQELGEAASPKSKHSMRVIADFTYKAITATFLKNTRNELYLGFRVMHHPSPGNIAEQSAASLWSKLKAATFTKNTHETFLDLLLEQV
jgi:hypothetical protein